MEHVPGRVFKDVTLEGMTPEERKAIYSAMNEVLTKIHKVNIEEAGLEDYGKKGNLHLSLNYIISGGCKMIRISGLDF